MTAIRKTLLIFLVITLIGQQQLMSQDFEWRLNNMVYNFTDPDGSGGPATGSVAFTLQIKAFSAPTTITGMTTGWSWQSANAMLPTGTGIVCGGTTNSGSLQPSNVTMSAAMAAASFTYNAVNQCTGTPNFTTGGQTFDRRASGTVDGGTITVPSSSWLDVFTVTLWALGNSFPQAGYAVINSAGIGSIPARFSSYGVSDAVATPFIVNSLTYTTPLALGASTVPVTFGSVNALCRGNSILISWTTEQEANSSYFEVQRSINGTDWNNVGSVPASGNSSVRKNYQLIVPQAGKAMFRINQVDVNGQSLLSQVSSANCGEGAIASSTFIYPVPAKDVINIRLNTENAGVAQITVMDATGRKVRGKAAGLISGMNTVSVNVSGLAAGTYTVLVIEENGKSETLKFVKE